MSTSAALPVVPQLRDSPSLFAHFVVGVTPHATQALFLEDRASVKIAACGRRWGKSTAAALDVLHLAVVGDAQGQPTEQMVIAPTSDQVTIICGEVERLLMASPLAPLVQSITHAPFFEVSLTNGSLIRGRSAANEGKYLRGRGAHRVVVDEAAFVAERTIQEAILPLLADTAGQLVLISTPFGRNVFWEFFCRGQGTDATCRSYQFPSHQNPHISRAYIEAQRGAMTDLQYRAEWLAEFLDDQSTVFKWALIERATQGELAGPRPGTRYAVGWDPAKYRDRSAVVVTETRGPAQHVVAVQTLEGRDYSRQVASVATLARTYNGASVMMDCTGNAALLEQLQATGVWCGGYQFTNATKNQLIDTLVLTLEQGRLTFPDVPALIAELRYYEYTMTAAGRVTLGAPDRANHYDDTVTALALSLWLPEQVTHEVVDLATWQLEPEMEAAYERERVHIGHEPDWGRMMRGLPDIDSRY